MSGGCRGLGQAQAGDPHLTRKEKGKVFKGETLKAPIEKICYIKREEIQDTAGRNAFWVKVNSSQGKNEDAAGLVKRT